MDTNTKVSSKQKQVVAPLPSDSSIMPSIYSITVNENESVKWQWLEFPDGNRVVINYEIIVNKPIL